MQKGPCLAGKKEKNTTTTELVRDRRSRKLTEKRTIRHLTEVISQKGGFSGEEARGRTLPCHEVRVKKTLLLEERGSRGSAPRD